MARTKRDTLAAIARDAVEAYAESKGLHDLAAKTDVNRVTLWRFASGKSSLTLDTFDKINRVLKIRISRR